MKREFFFSNMPILQVCESIKNWILQMWTYSFVRQVLDRTWVEHGWGWQGHSGSAGLGGGVVSSRSYGNRITSTHLAQNTIGQSRLYGPKIFEKNTKELRKPERILKYLIYISIGNRFLKCNKKGKTKIKFQIFPGFGVR